MGKAFAKKLRGFEVEVLCYDLKPNVGDENAKQVSLETLQHKTQILSLHVPHTELTFQMVNTDAKAVAATIKALLKGRDVVADDKLNMLIASRMVDPIFQGNNRRTKYIALTEEGEAYFRRLSDAIQMTRTSPR